MTLNIRYACQNDFDHVFNLLVQLWPEKILSEDLIRQAYSTGLQHQSEIFLIAEFENAVVGFAFISLDNSLYHGGRLAWVEALVTDKNVRTQGIGTALMDRVIEEAINNHCKAVEIMIDNQTNAVKFVKNKGFQLRGNAFELKLTIPR